MHRKVFKSILRGRIEKLTDDELLSFANSAVQYTAARKQALAELELRKRRKSQLVDSADAKRRQKRRPLDDLNKTSSYVGVEQYASFAVFSLMAAVLLISARVLRQIVYFVIPATCLIMVLSTQLGSFAHESIRMAVPIISGSAYASSALGIALYTLMSYKYIDASPNSLLSLRLQDALAYAIAPPLMGYLVFRLELVLGASAQGALRWTIKCATLTLMAHAVPEMFAEQLLSPSLSPTSFFPLFCKKIRRAAPAALCAAVVSALILHVERSFA